MRPWHHTARTDRRHLLRRLPLSIGLLLQRRHRVRSPADLTHRIRSECLSLCRRGVQHSAFFPQVAIVPLFPVHRFLICQPKRALTTRTFSPWTARGGSFLVRMGVSQPSLDLHCVLPAVRSWPAIASHFLLGSWNFRLSNWIRALVFGSSLHARPQAWPGMSTAYWGP